MRSPYLVPVIVGCAYLMQSLDSTVIATALPEIGKTFGEDPVRLNVAITSYLLSLAVFIPISGWLADRFGGRTILVLAIGIFAAASVLCGISQSIPELVGARIVQGFGGAMMVPVGRLIILRTMPKADLVQAMSYLTVPAVMGPALGPPIGGFIATYGSWRWIFFINVPIGIVGVLLVMRFIANVREEHVPPLDLRGFVLTGVGLAALLYGFETMGRDFLPLWAVIGLLGVGAACLALFAIHARLTPEPIVDPELLRLPTVSASVLGGGLFRIGVGALPFLLAMQLQVAFGLTPFASGLITFIGAVGALFTKFAAPPTIRNLGFRRVMIANGVIGAIFLFACALFSAETPHIVMLAILFVGGFFRSLQFTCIGTLGYAEVPPAMMSRANTLATMAQQLFLSLGVGLAALILHVSERARGGTAMTTTDIVVAYVIIAALGLLSVLYFVRLHPNVGADMSGYRPPR
ncbi:MAG TPA: MFS transporter [Alphaproteobacteria bacterium]|jgi:EmrB/QacA subfamily drug resistance transporter|nr:MFS transporter [Alphaproteobacteria bacterium]